MTCFIKLCLYFRESSAFDRDICAARNFWYVQLPNSFVSVLPALLYCCCFVVDDVIDPVYRVFSIQQIFIIFANSDEGILFGSERSH